MKRHFFAMRFILSTKPQELSKPSKNNFAVFFHTTARRPFQSAGVIYPDEPYRDLNKLL